MFFLVFIILIVIKRPTNKQAAILFDEFVQEDRVQTALNYIHDSSIMSQLQRREALTKMKQALSKLQAKRIKLLYVRPITIFGLLLIFTVTLYFLPSNTMKLALDKEKDQEIVEESKEKIEELAKEDESEKIKELEDQAKKITKSKDLLEHLLKEEANLAQEVQKAKQNDNKLKELAKAVNGLKELSEALNEKDSQKLSSALDNLLDREMASLSVEEKTALKNLLAQLGEQNNPDLSELTEEKLSEMLAVLEEELTNLIESSNGLNELLAIQQQVQNLAQALQQTMLHNGLANSNQLAFDNSSNSNQSSNSTSSEQNGSSNRESQGGSQADGNNNGQGNGNGEGNGSGSGAGNGSSSGDGTGTGTSNGTASGGSGAGFGQGSRELTIPERLEGDESIEDDFAELGEGGSEYQITPEGVVIKGNVRSYEEVYGEYANTYRSSVDRLDLPSYLENVVKDYFSDLNPEGE